MITALERNSPDSTGDRNGKQVGIKKMEMTRSMGRAKNTYQIMNMDDDLRHGLGHNKMESEESGDEQKMVDEDQPQPAVSRPESIEEIIRISTRPR